MGSRVLRGAGCGMEATMMNRTMKPFFALAVLATLCVSVLPGCGDDPKPKVLTPADVDTTPKPVKSDVGTGPKKPETQLNVSDEIMKICNIQAAPASTHFDFDSADLDTGEKDELGQLAKCLTTGPLKGKSVRLTGRADPRGEHEYNMSLGAQRANNVVNFLKGLGVEGGHLTHTSRGELDATGTDEVGWKKDRRVDVNLAN